MDKEVWSGCINCWSVLEVCIGWHTCSNANCVCIEVLGWRLEPLEPYFYADGEGLIAGPAEQVAKGSYRYLLSMDVSDLSDIDACIVIDENSGCFLPVSRKDGHIELFSSEIKWNKPVMLYDCISHTKRHILPGGV